MSNKGKSIQRTLELLDEISEQWPDNFQFTLIARDPSVKDEPFNATTDNREEVIAHIRSWIEKEPAVQGVYADGELGEKRRESPRGRHR